MKHSYGHKIKSLLSLVKLPGTNNSRVHQPPSSEMYLYKWKSQTPGWTFMISQRIHNFLKDFNCIVPIYAHIYLKPHKAGRRIIFRINHQHSSHFADQTTPNVDCYITRCLEHCWDQGQIRDPAACPCHLFQTLLMWTTGNYFLLSLLLKKIIKNPKRPSKDLFLVHHHSGFD